MTANHLIKTPLYILILLQQRVNAASKLQAYVFPLIISHWIEDMTKYVTHTAVNVRKKLRFLLNYSHYV